MSSKRIYKYPLRSLIESSYESGKNSDGIFEIELALPRGSHILQVAMQNRSDITAWAVVDPTEGVLQDEVHTICIYGTGRELRQPLDNLRHLNTFEYGPFIWHAFEVLSPA
jgi:hypothetical protein